MVGPRQWPIDEGRGFRPPPRLWCHDDLERVHPAARPEKLERFRAPDPESERGRCGDPGKWRERRVAGEVANVTHHHAAATLDPGVRHQPAGGGFRDADSQIGRMAVS
jgi:hypothetical protein